nr:MAG TPA: hypothetical protein [Caudoviricetes sp.]
MQNQERTPSKKPLHRGGSTRHQSSINELREYLRDFTQTDFHRKLLCARSRSIRRSNPRIVLSHRSRADSTHRNNRVRDLTNRTHHTCNGLVDTTELRLSRESKLINLAKDNLLTEFLLFTATLKLCLKLSEFNSVVRRLVSKRLKVSKGFVTESTVVCERLCVDFLGILIGVVFSLEHAVLSLKSRHYVLIASTEETTKETVTVIRAIEDTESKTCDTSTKTCTRNTLRSKFCHNYISYKIK